MGKKTLSAKGMKPSVPLERFFTGKYSLLNKPFLKRVPPSFCAGGPHYLLKETAIAFQKMAERAKKENVSIRLISGTRTFQKQKRIWEKKFSAPSRDVHNASLSSRQSKQKVLEILRETAPPGTSRHHWGTDCDLNSVESSYFLTMEGKKIYSWLRKNARIFGFFQPYRKGRKYGFAEEKWHWSYKPLSSIFLKEFRKTVHPSMIKGFQGEKFLPEKFLENYVFGISP